MFAPSHWEAIVSTTCFVGMMSGRIGQRTLSQSLARSRTGVPPGRQAVYWGTCSWRRRTGPCLPRRRPPPPRRQPHLPPTLSSQPPVGARTVPRGRGSCRRLGWGWVQVPDSKGVLVLVVVVVLPLVVVVVSIVALAAVVAEMAVPAIARPVFRCGPPVAPNSLRCHADG